MTPVLSRSLILNIIPKTSASVLYIACHSDLQDVIFLRRLKAHLPTSTGTTGGGEISRGHYSPFVPGGHRRNNSGISWEKVRIDE